MRQRIQECVYQLAKQDPRVVYIGSDLGAGTLDKFKDEMPDRFFMEGISEAHVIGMAAGLAKEGYIPYVHTISTFLTRRCFEQVAIDLCLHHLPVRLIGNGGGLVYAPLGPTHLAIEDMAIFRALPNMTIIAATDAEEMERLAMQSLDLPGPIYFRLGKGYDPVVSRAEDVCEIGKAILMREPGDVLIVTTGIMLQHALATADQLQQQGVKCGVLHMHTVKPLDQQALLQSIKDVSLLVTLEEHTKIGGLGSAVVESVIDSGCQLPHVLRLGIPDQFAENYGSQNALISAYGLDAAGVFNSIANKLKEVGLHDISSSHARSAVCN